MKKNFKIILTALLAFIIYPLTSHAGKDPIKWSLNRTFQIPVISGRAYSITYTFTNQLPLQLIKPLVIYKSASPASEFSYEDNCSGVKLQPKQSCTVSVILTPIVNGQKTVQLTIGGYDDDRVNVPEIITSGIGGSASANSVLGATTQSLPYQSTVGSSNSFTFTYTNYGSVPATNVMSNVTQSSNGTLTVTTNTCSPNGDPGTIPNRADNGSCIISGTYTPSGASGNQTVTGTITFDGAKGSPASTFTYTTYQESDANLIASLIVPDYLPPIMTPSGATYPTYFLFTNDGPDQVDFAGSHVGTITCLDSNSQTCGTCTSSGCTAGTAGNYLSGFSSDCNTNLIEPNPAFASCELQASFSAPAATSPSLTTYTITGTVDYTVDSTPGTQHASISTAGTVVSTRPTTRTVKLVNNCTFPVWYSFHGASVSGSCSTSTGLGCNPGTSCDQANGACYWTNPAPDTGYSYQLTQNGGIAYSTIPAYDYGGVQWSGNVSARLNCTDSSCAQAGCGNVGGNSSCPAGIGFTQPSTLAEFTMNVSSSDSYDVETINGFQVPISMQPVYYFNGTSAILATPDNYTCGSPGSYNGNGTSIVNGFGACNWENVSLPSPSGGTNKSSGYYWVTGGGTGCNISSGTTQCDSGQLCGIAIDNSTNALTTVCGNFLGYWTADQICSYSSIPSSVESFFNCTTKISTLPESSGLPFPSGSTLYDLYKCHVPNNDPYPLYNSCYNPYSGSTSSEIDTCCGCVNWWDPSVTNGQTIDSNDNAQSCGSQIDPVWTTYVQPMVQWMKAICPSIYTYQFDDKTSGFSCSNNLPNEANSVGYIITFCEGNSGLPSGATDAR